MDVASMDSATLAALIDSMTTELMLRNGSAAAHAVFETPELLEYILLQLPTKSTLYLQRVSKHWKAVIANSPQIQRALFKRREISETVFTVAEYGLGRHRGLRIVDRLAAHDFRAGPATALPCRPNTFLCLQPKGHRLIDNYAPTLDHQLRHGLRLPLSQLALEALRATPRIESSLLDMFLTQPPISEAQLIAVTQDRKSHKGAVIQSEGLRLGDIAAADMLCDLQLRRDPTLSLHIVVPRSRGSYCPFLFPVVSEDRLAHLLPTTSASQHPCDSSKAVDRFCAIDELLEASLRLLTLEEIMVMQRVSKQWQEVIRGSPLIQRAAFLKGDQLTMAFKPGRYGELAYRNKMQFSFVTVFPLHMVFMEKINAASIFADLMQGTFATRARDWNRRHSRHRTRGVVNATLCDHDVNKVTIKKTVLETCKEGNADGRLEMFFSQPPYHALTVHFSGILGVRFFRVYRSGGVRLRDVLAEARSFPIDLAEVDEHLLDLNELKIRLARINLPAHCTGHRYDLLVQSDENVELLQERQRLEAARLHDSARKRTGTAAIRNELGHSYSKQVEIYDLRL